MTKTNRTRKEETMTTTKRTTATWIVEYSDHDEGSPGGSIIRKTRKDAARTARLMGECGYRETSYRQWTYQPWIAE